MKQPVKPASKLQTVGPYLGDEELRLWLQRFTEDPARAHLTLGVLAKSDHIGVSRPALQGILDGTYFLSKDSGGAGVDPKGSSVEKKIRAYREKVEGAMGANGASVGFLETIAYRRLCMAWETAVNEKVIVVAYSDPG